MSTPPVRSFSFLTPPSVLGENVKHAALADRYLGVIDGQRRARVVKLGKHEEIPIPFTAPASDLAFRPIVNELRFHELAVAMIGDSNVRRFDLKTQIELAPLALPNAQCVAFSHDGSMLAAGSADGNVCIWQLSEDSLPERISCLHIEDSRIINVSLSALKDKVYATTATGRVVSSDLTQDEPRLTPALFNENGNRAYDWDCYFVATHPLATVTAFGGRDNTVWLHNTASNEVYSLKVEVGSFIYQIVFLECPNQVAVVGSHGIAVCDLKPLNVSLISTSAPVRQRILAARQFSDQLLVIAVPV